LFVEVALTGEFCFLLQHNPLLSRQSATFAEAIRFFTNDNLILRDCQKIFYQFSLFMHPNQAQNTLSGIQGQEATAAAVIYVTAPLSVVSVLPNSSFHIRNSANMRTTFW